jgi:tRNA 2-thiouridine synthesizing protein A
MSVAVGIDTGQQTCETLIRSVRLAIAPLPPGTILAVNSRDPSARLDLPAWCRMTGHTYLGNDDHETLTIHYLRKRENEHGKDDSLR